MEEKLQDVVDPVADEMLAKFVVDSHFKSQAKGGTMDDKSFGEAPEDDYATDTEVNISLDGLLCLCSYLLIIVVVLLR